jgi:hypothetical protein
MKKSFLIFLLSMSIVVTGSLAWAEPPEDHPFQDGKIKERVVTMRNWKLMEEFNLSGENAQKVFTVLDKFDDERAMLIKKRRDIKKELNEALSEPNTNDARLKELIEDFFKTNAELSSIPEKESKAMSQVFDLRDQAKLILFHERFIRDVKGMLHERFKKK